VRQVSIRTLGQAFRLRALPSNEPRRRDPDQTSELDLREAESGPDLPGIRLGQLEDPGRPLPALLDRLHFADALDEVGEKCLLARSRSKARDVIPGGGGLRKDDIGAAELRALRSIMEDE
jgi:hypothetical protein